MKKNLWRSVTAYLTALSLIWSSSVHAVGIANLEQRAQSRRFLNFASAQLGSPIEVPSNLNWSGFERRISRAALMERLRSRGVDFGRSGGSVALRAGRSSGAYLGEVFLDTAQSLLFLLVMVGTAASKGKIEELQDRGQAVTPEAIASIAGESVNFISDSGELWFSLATSAALTGPMNWLMSALNHRVTGSILKEFLKSGIVSLVTFLGFSLGSQLWQEGVMLLEVEKQEQAEGALNRIVQSWIAKQRGTTSSQAERPGDRQLVSEVFENILMIAMDNRNLRDTFLNNAWRLAIARGEFVVMLATLTTAMVAGTQVGGHYGAAWGFAASTAMMVAGGALTGVLPESIHRNITAAIQSARRLRNEMGLRGSRQGYETLLEMYDDGETLSSNACSDSPSRPFSNRGLCRYPEMQQRLAHDQSRAMIDHRYLVGLVSLSGQRSNRRNDLLNVLFEQYYQLITDQDTLNVRIQTLRGTLNLPAESTRFIDANVRAQLNERLAETERTLEQLRMSRQEIERELVQFYDLELDFFRRQQARISGPSYPGVFKEELALNVNAMEAFGRFIRQMVEGLGAEEATTTARAAAPRPGGGARPQVSTVANASDARNRLYVVYFRGFSECHIWVATQRAQHERLLDLGVRPPEDPPSADACERQ